jgi:hypothetical protein
LPEEQRRPRPATAGGGGARRASVAPSLSPGDVAETFVNGLELRPRALIHHLAYEIIRTHSREPNEALAELRRQLRERAQDPRAIAIVAAMARNPMGVRFLIRRCLERERETREEKQRRRQQWALQATPDPRPQRPRRPGR